MLSTMHSCYENKMFSCKKREMRNEIRKWSRIMNMRAKKMFWHVFHFERKRLFTQVWKSIISFCWICLKYWNVSMTVRENERLRQLLPWRPKWILMRSQVCSSKAVERWDLKMHPNQGCYSSKWLGCRRQFHCTMTLSMDWIQQSYKFKIKK